MTNLFYCCCCILFPDFTNNKDSYDDNVYQMNLDYDSQVTGCIQSIDEFKNNAELYAQKKPECA